MFLKIFLIGVAKVGKSSLLGRFCSGRSFEPGYHESTGPDFNGTKVKLQNGLEAVLQIWDLPGNPHHLARMDRDRREYWKETHVCILVCDMCSKDSFLALERLRQEFFDSFPESQRESLAFVLLINKAEATHAKKQQVFASDVLAWCAKHNIRHFYETSALTDTNILIALFNVTQLASEMDMIRRGIKVQIDAAEMTRREAEEAAAIAEQARVAAEKAAAEAQAILDAEAAAAQAEQDKLDAAARREKEFEMKWSAQKQEEEAAKILAATEKARQQARRKEEVDKRKKEVALSAYGQFKQRPHRLSVALIQQHAQSMAVDPADLGVSPALVALSGGGIHSDKHTDPTDPTQAQSFHKPGALPSSLHGPRTSGSMYRKSILGMGAGALLKQALADPQQPLTGRTSQLEGIAEGASAAPRPSTGSGLMPERFSKTNTPTPPIGAQRMSSRKHTFVRPGSQGAGGAPAGSSRSDRGAAGAVAGAAGGRDSRTGASSDTVAEGEVAGGVPPLSTSPRHRDAPSHLAQRSTPTSSLSPRSLATTSPSSRGHHQRHVTLTSPEGIDSVGDALLDYLTGLVSFTRGDCVDFYRLFGCSPVGVRFKAFKKIWSRLAHINPAWSPLAQRFFAAMDSKSRGLVEFEEFLLALQVLCHGPIGARAQLVWKVIDTEGSPFVTPKEPPSSGAAAGDSKDDGGDSGGSSSSGEPPIPTLTKASFAELIRTSLHGRDRFDHDMYEDGAGVVPEDAHGDDPPPEACLTRADFTKSTLLLLEGLPAFHALTTAKSGAGTPELPTTIAQRMAPLASSVVDTLFATMGWSKESTITLAEWKLAVMKRPTIIASYLPINTPPTTGGVSSGAPPRLAN